MAEVKLDVLVSVASWKNSRVGFGCQWAIADCAMSSIEACCCGLSGKREKLQSPAFVEEKMGFGPVTSHQLVGLAMPGREERRARVFLEAGELGRAGLVKRGC